MNLFYVTTEETTEIYTSPNEELLSISHVQSNETINILEKLFASFNSEPRDIIYFAQVLSQLH